MEYQELPNQERKSWPMFKPINETAVETLKNRISQNLGFDFSGLPVTIDRPGDYRFDYQEAQTKLYLKSGSLEDYKKLLEKYGLDFSNIPPSGDKLIRDIAQKEGVVLDDTFQGFVYNLGGRHIMYVTIREDRVMEMAEKYKDKEHGEMEIENIENAKRYLRSLAEKYFYHEAGHTIFKFLINSTDQNTWSDFVNNNDNLKTRVIEVQKDKHPSIEAIPIADEAFADLLTEIASPDNTNRLGDFPEALLLLKKILIDSGFNLPNKGKIAGADVVY